MMSRLARSPASAGMLVPTRPIAANNRPLRSLEIRVRALPRRAETGRSALRVIENILHMPLRCRHRRHHQLGDAIAAPDGESRVSQIDQNHLHFATIIGIDGAGGVVYGDAMPQ